MQFMRNGQTVKTFEVRQGMALNNVELPAATYDVRVFQKRQGKYLFTKTSQSSVSRDGWTFSYGCKPSARPKAPPVRPISTTSHRLSKGKNLCIVGFANGKQVLPGLTACGSHKAQRWMWLKQQGSPIQNAATGQCLTLLSNGGLDLRACDGSPSQRWDRAQIMPGWWQFSPTLKRGKCLTTSTRTIKGFKVMTLGTCGTYTSDSWKAIN